ncbi:MAG TPA: hypothetical protein VJO99_23675 [Burkholderiaceae bacterium]|nr:hypothetical protein [Burkholderiaceae bacterium]
MSIRIDVQSSTAPVKPRKMSVSRQLMAGVGRVPDFGRTRLPFEQASLIHEVSVP